MFLQPPFSLNSKDIQASFDLLFKDYAYTKPNIMCKCKSVMEYLCVSNCKQDSLHCGNKKCNHSNKKHKLCRIITLEGLTTLLGLHIEPHKIIITKLFEIEERFIEELRKRRQSIIATCRFGRLQDQEKVAIQEIYVKKNAKFSKGILINQVYDKLSKTTEVKDDFSEEVQFYQKEIDKVSQQLNKMFSDIVKNYNNSPKINDQMKNSTLLSTQKIKRRQQTDFLMKILQNPKKIQLLFRASEHNFSGSKFYQLCNKVKDVLVLVKTQFGKIIGGYNPHGWNSQILKKHTYDQQKKTFIFSVDLRQKMDLIPKKYAVYHSSACGPAFGGGSDLFISDSCNFNKSSYCYFPYSYNFTAEPYKNNQQSWTAFSGATDGDYFNVVQYEVFKVIK